jgi:hypothetical protein
MDNLDFHYEEFEEELHEKDHDREDRMARSKKAREKRRLIKDKRERRHAEGFRGNF